MKKMILSVINYLYSLKFALINLISRRRNKYSSRPSMTDGTDKLKKFNLNFTAFNIKALSKDDQSLGKSLVFPSSVRRGDINIFPSEDKLGREKLVKSDKIISSLESCLNHKEETAEYRDTDDSKMEIKRLTLRPYMTGKMIQPRPNGTGTDLKIKYRKSDVPLA